jgi:hypothetical protein
MRTVPIGYSTAISGVVETEALDGETLTLAIQLRQPDGSPVKALNTAPPGTTDPDGRFVRRTSERIQSLKSRWDSLMLTIPDGAVAIPAGPGSSLILTYQVSSGPLTAWSEEEYPAKHWP